MARELIRVEGHPGYQPGFSRDSLALEQARTLGLPWMARYTSHDGPSAHCHGLWGGGMEDLGGEPGPRAIPLPMSDDLLRRLKAER